MELQRENLENIYHLSPLQKGILFQTIKDTSSTAYFEQFSFTIKGHVDPELLQQSIDSLLAKYDVLRSLFLYENVTEPLQVVLKKRTTTLSFVDWTGQEEGWQAQQLEWLKREDRERGFQLSRDVLIRFCLVRLAADKHQLICSFHHILLDGWCIGLVFADLFALYHQIVNQQTPVVERSLPFSRYLAWLDEQDHEQARDYWRKYTQSYEQLHGIPRQRVTTSYQSQTHFFRFDRQTTEQLVQFASEQQVTVNSLFQTIWGILLQKYNDTNDVMFGAVVSGRPAEIPHVEKMVGLFINTVPVRVQCDQTMCFVDVLQHIQQANLRSKEYDYVSLTDMSTNTESPLFDHILAFESYPLNETALSSLTAQLGWEITSVEVFEQTHYDLNVHIALEQELVLKVTFNATAYDSAFIQRMTAHLEHIVKQVIAKPQRTIAEIELITETEKRQLLSLQQTTIDFPKEQTLAELFAQQVAKTPAATAVVADKESLTYQELYQRVQQLAFQLREKGVQREQIVAMMVEYTPTMLVGMLAVLQAGGAFAPIDISYPLDRVQHILTDSGAKLLLTETGREIPASFQGEVIYLDQLPWNAKEVKSVSVINHPQDLAYVIYTSGSTGKPKGVMVEHRSVINLVTWHNRTYQVSGNDRMTKFASFGFDASVWEVFPALLAGATIYHLPEEVRYDLIALHRFYEENGITISFLPTQFAEQFITYDNQSLRLLLVGGDQLRRVEQRSYQIVNHYGPTENTVVTTSCPVDTTQEIYPIGRPIANNRVYVLSSSNHLQPIGIAGELCVSGDSLARGYLHRPELTAEKFVPHPFITDERMYRTGDLVRWLPDGQLEFLGRIDDQVQVRGYRIELGEIEAQLLAHPHVVEAVVIAIGDGEEKQLCAYVVPAKHASSVDYREYLRTSLPDYMVPTHVVKMDALPVTANGKIDKRALPVPTVSVENAYVAPMHPVEVAVAEIWQDVLGIKRVGRTDHFFARGGHSLKAIQVIAKIKKQLQLKVPIRELFARPVLKEFADYIKKADRVAYKPIQVAPEQDFYPVTSAQKRMYVIQGFENVGTTYHMPVALMLTGKIDQSRIKQALLQMIDRHEILRTSFHLLPEGLQQKVHSHVALDYQEIRTTEAKLDHLLPSLIQPFDLEQAPLFRVRLLSLQSEKALLFFDFHHIISDGISTQQFFIEWAQLYQEKKLPKLSIQYKDYAVWQQEAMQSEHWQQQARYWKQQFADEVPVLVLPTDFPRPPVQQFTGTIFTFSLSKKQTSQLQQLAIDQGITLYGVLLAAYAILLMKYSGQEDIVVGFPIAGRSHDEVEQTLGMFVHTLAIRSQPKKDLAFTSFLTQIKQQLLQAYEHSEYRLEDLVEQLGLRRDLSRQPLFDTLFALQNMDVTAPQIPGLITELYECERNTAKFDLSWIVVEAEQLHISIEYRSDLFRQETIERMGQHFTHLLEQITVDPEQTLAELSLVTAKEKEQLLITFNDTALDYPTEQTIPQLFAQQVAQTPTNVAIVSAQTALTYAELKKRVDVVAAHLQQKGVQREAIVGLLVNNSPWMIVGMLAILQAGGAYLPLDRSYPAERMEYMLQDSQTTILLTERSCPVPAGFTGEVVYLDTLAMDPAVQPTPVDAQPTDLAYVIYTSGSTGKPKGVMVEQRSLLNLVYWHNHYYHVTTEDRATKFASFGFDASVWEVFPYLLAGATLYLIPDDIRYEPQALHRFYEENGITISFLPTQWAEQFMAEENRSLQRLLVGGDQLRQVVDRSYQVFNNYGPTENTVVTTCCPVQAEDTVLPIGRPIANNRVYVLNEELQLQPIGVPGELWISGKSLARGYLHRPELTAEKFIANPWVSGERMYRTGDLVRWLPNGTLEYLGRIDNQVKIRGYRIELGEIEARLLEHPQVTEVVAIHWQDDTNTSQLVAYIVGEADGETLRTYLTKTLPDYMIPTCFIPLEALPLTAHGKVDKNALPDPKQSRLNDARYAEPTDEREALLAHIWQEVLSVPQIGIHDNFFELGGDSIKAIQIMAQLQQANYKLEMKELFRLPTIAELAPCIFPLQTEINQGLVTGEVALTPIQRWFFSHCTVDRHHWNQSIMLFNNQRWQPSLLQHALTKVVEHHDALRIVFPQNESDVDSIHPVHRTIDEELFAFAIVDLRNDPHAAQTIEHQANDYQRKINIEHGPLMQVVLFQAPEGDHLLLIIHHLVVDGVSWRILLEDIWTGYQQVVQHQPIRLPAKTHSYQYWSQQFAPYTNSKALQQELSYWEKQETKQIAKLMTNKNDLSPTRFADMGTLNMQLSEVETKQLLTKVHHAYHTEINDLLLTALVVTIKQATNYGAVAITLEGHGREGVFDGVDISRTVGWFTTMYPVVFDLVSTELADAIKTVKETLRKVPNKGFGYGILKYFTDVKSLQLKPEISFNYLGQFAGEGISYSPLSMGEQISPHSPAITPIEITCLVENGRFQLHFRYDTRRYDRSMMQQLLNDLQTNLRNMIQHCVQVEDSEYTPSDFTAQEDLTMEDLDDIFDVLDEKLGE
jgi:amino acid adenylation domain-containing protein/non-ribosomal peptide synthase protein (TIGR01720 family)